MHAQMTEDGPCLVVVSFDKSELERRPIFHRRSKHELQKLMGRMLAGLAPGVFQTVALAADGATNECRRACGGRGEADPAVST